MRRVPTVVVSDVDRAERHRALMTLLGGRPPGAKCTVFAADAATLDQLQAEPQIDVRLAPAACPCCVGQVAFRFALTRLLRESAPQYLIIELPGGPHAPRIEAMLRDHFFSAVLDLVTERRAT